AALRREGDAAVERGDRLGDGLGVTPAADDEEAGGRAVRAHAWHGVEEIADALLPGEPPDGADRELVRGQAESLPDGSHLRPRRIEARQVDALPEDVQLLRGSEAR